MDKIKFANLVNWISYKISRGFILCENDLHELDKLITPAELPPAQKLYVQPAMVDELLAAMGQGKKIDAIKAYRALTGEGLKESKDAVEKYWVAAPVVVSKFNPTIADILK